MSAEQEFEGHAVGSVHNPSPNIDLVHLQHKLHNWRTKNFPNADATQQLLGVAEETGELAHAHLKEMQGIRGTRLIHEIEARDAVGDLVIFLMGYCSYREWDFEEIVVTTATTVFKRDWVADPETGGDVIDGRVDQEVKEWEMGRGK